MKVILNIPDKELDIVKGLLMLADDEFKHLRKYLNQLKK